MAPLPKRRQSTHRGGKRQGAISLDLPKLATCSHCGASIMPHRACPECGYYKGKPAVAGKSETTK